MSVRIDLLLDVLGKHPEQLDQICEELGTCLKDNTNRTNFIDDVSRILNRGFTSGPVSVYAKVLKQLRETQINVAAGKICTLMDALSSCCSQPLDLTARGVTLFHDKFPLMNELFKNGLVKWNILKVLITGLPKNTDVTIRYLCEIVQNVVYLYDVGVISDKGSNNEYWRSIVIDLRNQYYETDDRKAVADMDDLFKLLKKKHLWDKDCNPRDRKKRSSHSPSKKARSSVGEEKPDDRSKATRPAFLDRLQSSRRKSSHESREEGSSSDIGKRSHPPLIDKSQLNRLFASARAQAERSQSKQEQQSNGQLKQQSAISKVVMTLGTYPGYLKTATADIRTLLSKKETIQSFTDGVHDILCSTFIAKSEEGFSACIKLIENLRDLQIQPATGPIPVTFSFAVTKCVSCSATELETIEQVDAFCSSFRLTNELYKLNIVPSTLFNTYISEMAKGDNKISAAIIFKIARNFWTLVDGGFAVLSEEDVHFWQTSSQRLAFLLDKGVFGEEEADVLSFLKAVETKDGWRRKPVPVMSIKTTHECCKRAVSKGPVDGVITPSSTIERASPVNSERSGSVEEVAKPFKKKTIVKPENPWLDFSLKSGAVLNDWFLMIANHLKSIHAPFEFAKIIGKILVKTFVQIEDKITLAEACNICQKLSAEEFGRGKDFAREMRLFCLRYLSGKEQSDRNKSVNALMAAQSVEPGEIVDEDDMELTKRLALETLFKKQRIGCVRLIGRLFMDNFVDLTYAMSFVNSLMIMQTEEYVECLLVFFKDAGKHFLVRISETGQEEWFKKLFEELRKLSKEDATSTQTKKLINEIIALKKCWPHVDARLVARLRLTELLANLNIGGDHSSTMNRVRELLEHESPNKHVGGLFELLVERIELYLTERPASVSHASGDTSCSGTPLPDLPPVMQISDMDAQLPSTGKRSHDALQPDLLESPALKKIASSQ